MAKSSGNIKCNQMLFTFRTSVTIILRGRVVWASSLKLAIIVNLNIAYPQGTPGAARKYATRTRLQLCQSV